MRRLRGGGVVNGGVRVEAAHGNDAGGAEVGFFLGFGAVSRAEDLGGADLAGGFVVIALFAEDIGEGIAVVGSAVGAVGGVAVGGRGEVGELGEGGESDPVVEAIAPDEALCVDLAISEINLNVLRGDWTRLLAFEHDKPHGFGAAHCLSIRV